MTTPILDIRHLSVDFHQDQHVVHAVRDISFNLMLGEILCIVGESGSGKSVSALGIMGLLANSARLQGEVLFHNPRKAEDAPINLLSLVGNDRRSYRGGLISMIFQEPMTSLNPVLTCGDQVMEAILLHNKVSRDEAYGRTVDLLREVK